MLIHQQATMKTTFRHQKNSQKGADMLTFSPASNPTNASLGTVDRWGVALKLPESGPQAAMSEFHNQSSADLPPPEKNHSSLNQTFKFHRGHYYTQKNYNGTWKRLMSESACFSRVPFSRGVIVLPTQTKHDMGNHPKLPYLCIV